MNNSIEQLIKGLRQIALSDASYKRIRGALESYADVHAVADSAVSATPAAIVSGWMRTRQAVYAFSLMGIFILGGGSAAFGAEQALPGDTLYPLKIHVNEAVSATFMNSVEEKATWNARLAERRAGEAVKLADEGKLDATTAAYISEQVSIHVAESDSSAAELETAGDVATALAVRTNLEERLTAHARALHSRTSVEADTLALAVAVEGTEPSAELALAESFDAEARKLAEARMHSESAVLPGFASVDAATDLGVIRQPQTADTATMISATAVAEADALTDGSSVSVTAITVNGSSTVQVETSGDATVRVKEHSEIRSSESLWLNIRR